MQITFSNQAALPEPCGACGSIRSRSPSGSGPAPENAAMFQGEVRDAFASDWGRFEGEVVARWENDGRRMTLVEPFDYVDPRLARWPAARLLGIDADALLEGQAGGPAVPRDETLLRKLFESLVTLRVQVAAEAAGARVRHLR